MNCAGRKLRPPRCPMQTVVVLRRGKNHCHQHIDEQRKSLRDGYGSAHTFGRSIPAARLSPPPQQAWRTGRCQLLRLPASALKRLCHQNEISATAAAVYVSTKFGTAALGPMAILQRLREFDFVGACTKRHAFPRTASVCSRSRRAILRRALKSSNRMPAAFSPVISEISRCE